MNRSFPDRHKYEVWEKKTQKTEFKFKQIFICHLPDPCLLFLAYLVIIFVLGHQLWKKLYLMESNQLFYLERKFWKMREKIQPVAPYTPVQNLICLPKTLRDNGPLGIQLEFHEIWILITYWIIV